MGIKRFLLTKCIDSLPSLVGPTDECRAGPFHVGAGSTGHTEHACLALPGELVRLPQCSSWAAAVAAVTVCEAGPQARRWLEKFERAESDEDDGRPVPGSWNVDVRAGARAAIREHKEESDVEEFLETRQEPSSLRIVDSGAHPGLHLSTLGFGEREVNSVLAKLL